MFLNVNLINKYGISTKISGVIVQGKIDKQFISQ